MQVWTAGDRGWTLGRLLRVDEVAMKHEITLKRPAALICAALLLVLGCTDSPDPAPDPLTDGFTSLQQLATTVNASGWECDAGSAADQDATTKSLTDVGFATMTCGKDGRLTIWASDTERQEQGQRAPFALNPDFCHLDGSNWTVRGTPEMTRALRGKLGTPRETCAIE